jgi:hypothetical protein
MERSLQISRVRSGRAVYEVVRVRGSLRGPKPLLARGIDEQQVWTPGRGCRTARCCCSSRYRACPAQAVRRLREFRLVELRPVLHPRPAQEATIGAIEHDEHAVAALQPLALDEAQALFGIETEGFAR